MYHELRLEDNDSEVLKTDLRRLLGPLTLGK